jgi:hypothetical protein
MRLRTASGGRRIGAEKDVSSAADLNVDKARREPCALSDVKLQSKMEIRAPRQRRDLRIFNHDGKVVMLFSPSKTTSAATAYREAVHRVRDLAQVAGLVGVLPRRSSDRDRSPVSGCWEAISRSGVRSSEEVMKTAAPLP